MVKIREIINLIEGVYPLEFSEHWDKSGLQVGNTSIKTSKIIMALDPLKEVIRSAVEKNAKLVITHHPLSLKPVFPIDTETYLGNIIKTALLNDITIYSAHTNFDSAEPTVSDALLNKLNLNYTDKTFLSKGKTTNSGLGRIVNLSKSKKVIEILNDLKEKTFAKYLRFTGDIDKVINRLAVMGGSGASFIELAYKSGADLYITGDIKYHDARLAEQLGISVVDLGHFYSEYQSLEILKELLLKNFSDLNIDIFKQESDPFILWR